MIELRLLKERAARVVSQAGNELDVLPVTGIPLLDRGQATATVRFQYRTIMGNDEVGQPIWSEWRDIPVVES